MMLIRFLILLLAFSLPFQLSHSQTSQATVQQLETLKSSINELQGWLDRAKDERSSIQSDLKSTEINIGGLIKKIGIGKQHIAKTETSLGNLETRQRQLLSAKVQQEQLLARQIRAAYGIGRGEYLKVLLNQEQPGQVSRVLTYYDYFNRARSEQIDTYVLTINQLQENAATIEREQLMLQQAQFELQNERTALDQTKDKRQVILIKLDSSIKDGGQELEKMLADQNRLEELLNAVGKTIADIDFAEPSAPILELKGNLPWPAQGKIVRSFGSRDTANSTRWSGVLIRAQEGKNVSAIHHGRVVFADWLRGFGLLIIIDHGSGYMSLYGRNQALYKETGDWVNPGDVIAVVGSSGGNQQAGLYFEIRRNGKPENPKHWIVKSG